MRIFIAGGTGNIGKRLVPQLRQRGDHLVVLSRSAAKIRAALGDGSDVVEGDPMQPGPWQERVSGCDAVVNLVGEGIFNRRWSTAFKTLLRDSRILSTQNIVEAIRRAAVKPRVLIHGSAIGFYGFHEDEVITEASPPGDDFLAKLCVEWEACAKPVEEQGVRLVLLRTGVVLDPHGGALTKMAKPIRFFVGGKIGSGRQWVGWIHHADETGLICFALDNPDVRGPLNAVAPEPVTNKQLTKALGAVLHRPTIFPAPSFALRVALGEVAGLITKGQRVVPQKALDAGYTFQFLEVAAALRELYQKANM